MEIEMTYTFYFFSFSHFSLFSSSDRFAPLFTMYSRKYTSPNYIVFLKNQTRSERLAWSQKRQQIFFGEKEEEAINAIRNAVIQDAENLELNPVLELNSEKESTMDQEPANCNKTYDIAFYKIKQVCVTIKKYNVNEPPFFQIRIIVAKEKEAMKEVAYVNYILNKFKELSKSLGDFTFVENCYVKKSVLFIFFVLKFKYLSSKIFFI